MTLNPPTPGYLETSSLNLCTMSCLFNKLDRSVDCLSNKARLHIPDGATILLVIFTRYLDLRNQS